MSHADYEVKWDADRKKWALLQRTPDSYLTDYRVVKYYGTKAPAKKQGLKFAQEEDASFAAYSKTRGDNDRVTYQKDYGEES